ncbi:hypothetical protein EGI22_04665 [Lacihabitans sp. LS3-19]|uniref:RNA polymerase alpha subunit C-terminal domain-containing protein n=1 Tax=Lacihabitans sp. LS3-19 TaxID=2487335 RepID=UPI0020CDC55F|nr:RNA polymerase alpha subunit C-terminal domain-containing protein [Lacihabitans sp. LS3-19]MCP9767191.1 hypothetical protein [Lacihabitans sp. LS3-19]
MKTLKSCKKGHKFYKSSDCPVCPVCEKAKKSNLEFLQKISSPARRALENIGIINLEDLTIYSEKELLKLHGIGPASIPILRNTLENKNLSFKK